MDWKERKGEIVGGEKGRKGTPDGRLKKLFSLTIAEKKKEKKGRVDGKGEKRKRYVAQLSPFSGRERGEGKGVGEKTVSLGCHPHSL